VLAYIANTLNDTTVDDINQCSSSKLYFSKMSSAHTSLSSSKRVEADTIKAETDDVERMR
jgi:hypothetical protein